MTLKDKELIEQAARATGILGGFCDDRFLCTNNSGGLTQWNPLDSNADCAQMEAELQIDIYWLDNFVEAVYFNKKSGHVEIRKQNSCNNADGTDKAAARRRASTRVAAQVGR